MSNNDITQLSLTETIAALADQKFSLAELNQAYLERINTYNPRLNAVLAINADSQGLPAVIKDAISTKGIATTAGSKILEGYTPVYNAAVIDLLTAQNVSTIAKANMDEFAMGSSGENSAYGSTKNPWDVAKIPGGSSSGSAVAVAADFGLFALGSDTGGSIRQPAAMCGVVGYKPSYGEVSRYGLIAMASSLDQIGTFTKTVADTRLVMSWIAGNDSQNDSNLRPVNIPSQIGLTNLKGLKIGIAEEYFGEGLDAEVNTLVQQTLDKLTAAGAEIVPVSLPHTKYAVATYYIIMASEVSSNLGRFDGLRFGHSRDAFGAEVKRRLMLGTFALSTGYFDDYYIQAAKVRTLINQDFELAFEKCDVIASPVSPTVAWNIGQKIDDPLTMYLSDIYTIPTSLAGLPAISIPCGLSQGLPVGFQLIGQFDQSAKLLDIAELAETEINFKEKPVL